MTKPGFYIMPAEHVGEARHGDNGILRIGEAGPDGTGVVEINLARTGLDPAGYCCWWNTHTVGVYVRRASDDLSVIEIHMARHDGLSQEELDAENAEAERYPLGAKEYWRAKMVGKYTYGPDGHLMTNEEFEADWAEGCDEEPS
jgi:hypothetical protein